MQKHSPDLPLSIIICTWNRNPSLLACLQSLIAQTVTTFEVIIVNGADTDSVAQLTKAFPSLHIRILSDPHRGLAVARDLGWRQARGSIIAWIDDDVVVNPNWVKELLNTFHQYPYIGGVSGPTIIPKNLLSHRVVFWWYNNKNIFAKLWIKLLLDGHPETVGKITRLGWWSPGSNFVSCLKLTTPIPVDYLEACNMAIQRNLIDQVGGFDLKFKGTSEWCEVDLARRVATRGYQLLFNSKVTVEHHVSRSGVFSHRRNLAERIYNYGRFLYKNVWFEPCRWYFSRTSATDFFWHCAKFCLMRFYFQIDAFVIRVARLVDHHGQTLLDVGSGSNPYRKYFKYLTYKTLDLRQNSSGTIDYLGDLNQKNPALKDKAFDYILCTQVLEHLHSPNQAFQEFHRILKSDGRLFLTTNFMYQIHMAPHDYYRFTRYGLRYLGESNGFKLISEASQGGIFHVMSYLITTLPLRLFFPDKSPFYFLYLILFSPVIISLNLVSMILDIFDKKRELTINYSAIYEKI